MEVVALLRDLVIILFGVVWIIAGAMVAIVAWITWQFLRSVPRRAETVTSPAKELYGQAREAVGTAGESVRTAREAIVFVSEKAVLPTIAVVSAVNGIKRFVGVLLAGNRPEEERRA
jgi:hypothetical protein